MEIFGLNIIKSAIIILIVLLYWKFVYYKYHKKPITPISYFVVGGILFLIGIYAFFFEKTVNFYNIRIVHYIIPSFLIISFILVLTGIKKHRLDADVDITLTWAKKTFPFIPFWFWMIVAFPALFFVAMGTFKILGPEHIILWSMIFGAWIISNRRLYKKRIAQ